MFVMFVLRLDYASGEIMLVTFFVFQKRNPLVLMEMFRWPKKEKKSQW